MPPKVKVTKNSIIDTTINLIRKEGEIAINARRIAKELNCSTQPIFSNFENMDVLLQNVRGEIKKIYESYLKEDMASGKYPPYKASGMAYIRFAREEKELFKILFMCDRKNEFIDDRESIKDILKIIENNLGINEEEALYFHLEMWIYVHGIATMIATSYLNFEENFISKLVTDAYVGIKHRYCKE